MASTLTNDAFSGKRPTADTERYGAIETTGKVSAVEKGWGDIYHITVLTVADLTIMTDPGGANALGYGALVYTFPAGRIIIDKAYINIELTTAGSTVTNDTPELSLGNVVCTGAVATMTTGTWENIMTAQVAVCDGTAEVATVAATLTLETADAHAVYLNLADTWAGAEATGVQAAGTIILVWKAL